MSATTGQQTETGAQFLRDADFTTQWWLVYERGQAPLLDALDLARVTGADLDGMVGDAILLVESGMVRLAPIFCDAPERAPHVKCVLTDPTTPYSAAGEQDDPAQPDGAGYKGPGNSANTQSPEGAGKTAPGATGGPHDGYRAVGEGGR